MKSVIIGTFQVPGRPRHGVYAWIKKSKFDKSKFSISFDGYYPAPGIWDDGGLEDAISYMERWLPYFEPSN